MTAEEIRAVILELLGDIAPEIDAKAIDSTADLREVVDIDSMDFLNLTIAIAERLGVEIREQDYDDVRSLDALVSFVGAAQGKKRSGSDSLRGKYSSIT